MTIATPGLTLDVWDISNLCEHCDFNEDRIYEELMASIKKGVGGEWHESHDVFDENEDSRASYTCI